MREKAIDLVYLNTKKYSTLADLKKAYWALFIVQAIMLVMGFGGIRTMGASWKTSFPIFAFIIWNLLFWIFISCIQNAKNTFELRFLVNGISGLLFSLLIWFLFACRCIFDPVGDNGLADLSFCLWLLPLYVLFSVSYIALIVLGVHKGVFKKIRKQWQSPVVLAIDALLASLIPLAVAAGMVTSRILRSHASVSTRNLVMTIGPVLLIFLPALGHINFVQYFYCKKYQITCDEDGNTNSPGI